MDGCASVHNEIKPISLKKRNGVQKFSDLITVGKCKFGENKTNQNGTFVRDAGPIVNCFLRHGESHLSRPVSEALRADRWRQYRRQFHIALKINTFVNKFLNFPRGSEIAQSEILA